MAVKVVYDATRGLVQENDSTGVGGFQIKDVSLTEGTDTANATAAGVDIPAVGVTLASTTGGGDANGKVKIANGTVIGQQKTVIYLAEAAAGDNLLIRTAADGALATLDVAGDVAVFIWSGASWLLVNQAT
jgi:hypothetical protein